MAPIVDLLSIAIPTFERPTRLLRMLRALLPQIPEGMTVRIIDNASPTSVADLLQRELPADLNRKVMVDRNLHNIGGNANVCRCFERCTSEWLWVLGDDDVVVEGAIIQAIGFIRTVEPETVFINLGNVQLDHPVICVNSAQLLDRAPSLGGLLCLPMCLYRVSRLHSHLRYAYQWLSTCAPQLVIVLQSMHVDGSSAVLRPECLRQEDGRHPFRGSAASIAWCTATLAHLPIPAVDARRLARLLPGMVTAKELIYDLRLGVASGQYSQAQARRIHRSVALLKFSGLQRWLEALRFLIYDFHDRIFGFNTLSPELIQEAKEDRT